MLTQDPRMVKGMVGASLETAHRRTGEPTHVRLVVDENKSVIAPVTDKYTLIQNADFVSAFELAADQEDVKIAPDFAHYHRGRMMAAIRLPELEYAVTGDPSKIIPRVVLRNDYRGGGGLRVLAGWFRLECSNGLVRQQSIAYQTNQRHVGRIDLFEIALHAVRGLRDTAEIDRMLAENLVAQSAVEWVGMDQSVASAVTDQAENASLEARIVAGTSQRYVPDLHRAVREYQREVGNNLWALAQAVSEVATHRMQQRREFNMAADAWATRQLELIEQEVM